MKAFGDIKIGSFWKLKEEFEGMLWNNHIGDYEKDYENGSPNMHDPNYPSQEIDKDIYELIRFDIKDTSNQRWILAVFKGIKLKYIFAHNVDNIKDYFDFIGKNKDNLRILYGV